MVRMRSALFLLASGAAVAVGSCVPDAPPRVQLSPATAVPAGAGLVLWVDGLDIDVFSRLQRAGKLPHITRWLIDRGVTVDSAITSLPTITYANDVSFVTGLFPGHHGIVGNKWFDRHKLILQNYGFIKTYQQVDADFTAQTIYEALPHDYTATILAPVRRGATRNIDNWASAGVAWFFGFQETVNHLTTLRFELISGLANRSGRWPKFILAYFAAPDTVAHQSGPDSPRYVEILLDVDRQIGNICQALEQAGLLERTYVTLVCDHGFVQVPRYFELGEYFRKELQIPTREKLYGRDVPFEQRLAHFEAARAVVVSEGNRRCSIHLRADEHWWQRPTVEQIDRFHLAFGCYGRRPQAGAAPDLLALLAGLEAVDLAAVRLGDDAVRVQSRHGAAVIDRVRREGVKLYRYRVLAGTDPLGYASKPQAAALMDGQHHDAEAWLRATLDTDRPDVVVQLAELNDSPRSGDIVLFSADGWDFSRVEVGGHGGLLRHEIVVPWIWAGPGLPAGTTIKGARTVDLMPTMLDLIGRSEAIPAGLDGSSLAPRLRRASGGGRN